MSRTSKREKVKTKKLLFLTVPAFKTTDSYKKWCWIRHWRDVGFSNHLKTLNVYKHAV